MFFSIIAQVYYGRNKTMFDKDGVNQLQVYKNAWEQFKVSVVDFYGTQRTAKAQKMLNIDVAELNLSLIHIWFCWWTREIFTEVS